MIIIISKAFLRASWATSLALVFSVAAWGAEKGGGGRAPGSGRFALLQSRVVLEKVGARELGHRDTESINDGRISSGLVMRVDRQELFFDVVRSVPNLWRQEFDKGADVSITLVWFDVIGTDGQTGVLVHAQYPDSKINVQVEVLPVVEVPGGPNADLALEGGVRLIIDVRSARYAGEYLGTLRLSTAQP